MTLPGARHIPGERRRHNVKPRTPREAPILRPGSATIPEPGAVVLSLADDPCRHVLQGVPQSWWMTIDAPTERALEISKRPIAGTSTNPGRL